MSPARWLSARCFQWIHGNHLVYNTCWEDPRLDRVALGLGSDDVVLVITSAGCNALDYLLLAPQAIHAVDLNPRQNALLELKAAGIRALEFDDFFALFGRGRSTRVYDLYPAALRPLLSERSCEFWDQRLHFFAGGRHRPTFYFHGTTGLFAWLINHYIDRVARAREMLEAIFAAGSVEQQRTIYDEQLKTAFWKPTIRWLVRRDTTMSMLGVPGPQRRQIDQHYAGGIAQFIEDALEAVFARLSLADNYFWRVYLTGCYTPACCPEYLKPDNFERLKAGLIDRLQVHTDSVTNFLNGSRQPISRFVLLDHMDWLSAERRPLLVDEWQAIVDRAAPHARLLWRSAGTSADFVNSVPVRHAGRRQEVGDILRYDSELAGRLHDLDRVHTYGSFYIADLAA